MTLTTLKDNEAKKFTKGKSGEPAVRTTFDGSSPVPVETSGVEWDEIVTTFPEVNQDLVTYKLNSVTVQTVLGTYEGSLKKQVLQISKARF